VFDEALLDRLLELARRHDLQVVSDEVYEDIVFDAPHRSLAADGDERVATVFAFSKSYAMTGWRLGYLVARPEIAEAVVRVQEAFLACPSWISQVAGEAALTGPQDCLAVMRASYQERRDAAVGALQREGLHVATPHGAFYVMARLGPVAADTFAAARRLVLEQGIAVSPGETFGPAGAQLVRLSLASRLEDITEGIARLGRAKRAWQEEPRDEGGA
jgi:aspartate aminotransferase/aminotransferase